MRVRPDGSLRTGRWAAPRPRSIQGIGTRHSTHRPQNPGDAHPDRRRDRSRSAAVQHAVEHHGKQGGGEQLCARRRLQLETRTAGQTRGPGIVSTPEPRRMAGLSGFHRAPRAVPEIRGGGRAGLSLPSSSAFRTMSRWRTTRRRVFRTAWRSFTSNCASMTITGW